MSDLSRLTKQPKPFTHGGKVYQMHPLEIDDFGRLQAWVDSQRPDPFAEVAKQIGIGRFTVAQEKHLIEAAVKVSIEPKPKIGTPEADAILVSLAGVKQFFYLSVRKGDPDFTEAEAAEVVDQLNAAELNQVLTLTTVDKVASDPKSSEGSRDAGTAISPTARRSTGGSSTTKR